MKQKDLVSTIIAILWILFITALVIGVSCQKQHDIDMESFKELARNADCADISNRLFLIDNKLVFWDRRGNCPDNGYAQILFGKSPDEELCSRKDSIAGPILACENNEEFGKLFETILNNLDDDNLGLSPNHQVEPISFLN